VKRGLYIQKEKKGSDEENNGPVRRGWTEMAGKKTGMKTRQPDWNDLHYMEGKTNKWQPV